MISEGWAVTCHISGGSPISTWPEIPFSHLDKSGVSTSLPAGHGNRFPMTIAVIEVGRYQRSGGEFEAFQRGDSHRSSTALRGLNSRPSVALPFEFGAFFPGVSGLA